jgi:hypothetical protein
MSSESEQRANLAFDLDALQLIVCIASETQFPKWKPKERKYINILLDGYLKLGIFAVGPTGKGSAGEKPTPDMKATDLELTEIGRAWLATILATRAPRRIYITDAGRAIDVALDDDEGAEDG